MPSSVGCLRGTQVRGDYHEDPLLNEGPQKLESRPNVKTRGEVSSTHVFAAGITEHDLYFLLSKNCFQAEAAPQSSSCTEPQAPTPEAHIRSLTQATQWTNSSTSYPKRSTRLETIYSQSCAATSVAEAASHPPSGPYWVDLKRIRTEFDNSITARDTDALFLRYAFDLGCFHMALGFRSGALDLFSLLGIPTVSIGLRNLIGEDRHDYLAQKIFRRINVKYDLPRHKATAWIRSNYRTESKADVGVNVLCSPFFLKQAKLPFGAGVESRNKPLNEDAELEECPKLPGSFCDFDKWVLQVGVSIACEKYLGSRRSINRMTPEANDFVINRAYARYCYAADIGKVSDLPRHFAQLKEMEMRAVASRL
ncbi:hypothetical protein V496_00362 [Pseudogymnoascus sp. VKM F-4515 (FW-2607)]|nr:hypothetical protein V496_00362 [Pseudogymnoascus sp. VKM F-4515 (FW-2607)]KFY96070.1 hypothetical protein V498_02924 [Pseudogymnoascus sp. VKM F-4517 (FW-2822)]